MGDCGGYRIGGCAHRGDGLAIGFVTPLPSTAIRFSYSVGGAEAGRLALMIDGVSIAALRSLVKFSFSSNQALTRAAFTNLWPDFMLIGDEFGAKGYGGVKQAGFWGPRWELDSVTAFSEWCEGGMEMERAVGDVVGETCMAAAV